MNEKLSLLTLFIEKINEAKAIELSQAEIARQLKISANTINRYYNGRGQMQTDTYENIINLINSKLNEKAKK